MVLLFEQIASNPSSTVASESVDSRGALSSNASPLVTISQLTIRADVTGAPLVNNVSLSVACGGTLGIVGESGSGKSLTCRALLGILPAGVSVSSGKIDFDGIDIRTASRSQWQALRGRRIASVFQDPASYINPSITVGKQLEEVLKATLGLRRAERRSRAAELLTAVGLRDAERVRHQYAHELSGGMLQRVLIAMAIAAEPDLLIADEATTALDVTVQAEVLALLEELRISHNLTLILVSHDLAVVSAVCDHIVVFRNGEVIEEGTSTDVLTRPQHPYTRELIRGHQRYGLERILNGAPVPL